VSVMAAPMVMLMREGLVSAVAVVTVGPMVEPTGVRMVEPTAEPMAVRMAARMVEPTVGPMAAQTVGLDDA
jgi:hypothetical protein